ncbi:MAG: hypothetical protein DMD95_07415 [Candidatus Rokuibacteriota bacterium]|nr:MAG: hypothetical protein DMD95_07415 [Candidatus Rokubacteria bacterium]
MVPATMTDVPTTIGSVMRSPSSMIASAEATKGLRLMRAAEIEAPTFSIETNLRSRPPTVPMRPARPKRRAPLMDTWPGPPVTMTAVQRLAVPTTTLIQNPVYGSPPRSPRRMKIVAAAEQRAPASARTCMVCGIMERRSSYSEVCMRRSIIRLGIIVMTCLVLLGTSWPAAAAPEGRAAAPEGTVTWGVHITLASRWLDPAETEGIITPFMVLYALHDALVKPMPAGWNTPSLAESWSQSKDGLTYEFVLRKGVKFHNGDPVTAEDVKFSFERYRGSGAKLLKDRVREVQLVDAGRVRFHLKEAWPDFMTFYGTSATGSGWIVPKKYVEKVGDDGFKKAPIGAGPYRFVSFNPGVELVMEAYEGYWRKTPSVKRLVLRSLAEETTRAAALKKGEVDISYLLTGPVAEEIRRTPGLKLTAPSQSSGVFWLDMPDQWDPKSPWHDRRVRLAASHAIDRQALNQAETLGFSKPTGGIIPRAFEFSKSFEPPALDPARAKQLLAEAGYPNGFDAGDFYPWPPYTSMGEALASYLQAVGIRSRIRTMERATLTTAWREKKLKGLIVGITGAGGNAATRLEAYVSKEGVYTAGVIPEVEDLFQRQARETDVKRREALIHQIQQILHDRVTHIPIYELAFTWGIGPRLEQPGISLIRGYAYSAPYEDLKLKRP